MTSDYKSYLLICPATIAYLVLILLKMNSNIGTERQLYYLRRCILYFILYNAADFIWALGEGGTIPYSRTANAVNNSLVFIFISLTSFAWFNYVIELLEPKWHTRTSFRLISGLPLLISTVSNIASIWTGATFTITPDNVYITGPLFILQDVFNYIYVLAASLISLWKSFHAKDRKEKQSYRRLSLFITGPILGAAVSFILQGVPMISCFMFLVILLLFLGLQDQRIYNDALTGLYNRRRLEEYRDELSACVGDDETVVIFIADVNHFKSINDTRGHLTGDDALRVIGASFDAAAEKYGGFAARYGGDEFTLIQRGEKAEPQEIIDYIRSQVRDRASALDSLKDLNLTVSVGYAFWKKNLGPMKDALAEADQMMYRLKPARTERRN